MLTSQRIMTRNRRFRGFKSEPPINYNLLSGILPYGLTFSRASNAWYYNSYGVLTQASSGVPRFDCNPSTLALNGLLVEEQRTNLFLQSASPATQNVTTAAQTYTLSFYGTGNFVLSGTYSGTVTGSGAFPTRSTLTFTATAGTLTLTAGGTILYPQLEAGSFATSYIPTTTAAVTRAADLLYTANIPWFNATQGVMVAEVMPLAAANTDAQSSASFSNSGIANTLALMPTPTGYSAAQVSSGGTFYYSGSSAGILAARAIAKLGLSYKSGENYSAYNGALDGSGTMATAPLPSGITRLDLMNRYDGARPLNGWLRSFKYWNTALSKAQLQQVTQ